MGIRSTLALLIVCAVGPSSRASTKGSIEIALGRAVDWLHRAAVDPFDQGVDGFRLFAVEVETWHRLWALEVDPVRKEAYRRETVARLEKLNAASLREIFRHPGATRAFTDAAILAARARTHGADALAIRQVLEEERGRIAAEIDRVVPSLQLLYAAILPDAGLASPVAIEGALQQSMLATRPPEISLTQADVYYLTHEIFALTDYALRPLGDRPAAEREYLRRVLPFYTIMYGALNNLDLMAELVTCLHTAGMTDAFAYREGIRVLLERQNADGSFGEADPQQLRRAPLPRDYLHPTMNAITALLLDLQSRRVGGTGM